jgi:hypothetical protein
MNPPGGNAAESTAGASNAGSSNAGEGGAGESIGGGSNIGGNGSAGAPPTEPTEEGPASITCEDENEGSRWLLVDFPSELETEPVTHAAIGFGMVHLRTTRSMLSLDLGARTWARARFSAPLAQVDRLLAVPGGVVVSVITTMGGEPPTATYGVNWFARGAAPRTIAREPVWYGPVPFGADEDVLWFFDSSDVQAFRWATQTLDDPISHVGSTSALLVGSDVTFLEIRLNARNLSRLDLETESLLPLSPPPAGYSSAAPHVAFDTGFASVTYGASLYYDATTDSWTPFDWTEQTSPVRAGNRIAVVAEDGGVTLTAPQTGEVETSGDDCAPGFTSVAFRAGSKDGVLVWGDVSEASPGRGAVLLVAE